MAKKRGRHARNGGRTTPKGTRPLQLVRNDRPRVDGPTREPGMMEMVAEHFKERQPGTMFEHGGSQVGMTIEQLLAKERQ